VGAIKAAVAATAAGALPQTRGFFEASLRCPMGPRHGLWQDWCQGRNRQRRTWPGAKI